MNREFSFHLRGRTLALLDWANIFGTTKKKWKIFEEKLFEYLKNYPETAATRIFAGEDDHPKSRVFLEKCEKIGFEVVTKKVKYLGERRKCDFDVEITMAMILGISEFETFLLFSGDGDYAPVVKYLLKKGKRVFVIAEIGSLGREIWELKKEKIAPIVISFAAIAKNFAKKMTPENSEKFSGRD